MSLLNDNVMNYGSNGNKIISLFHLVTLTTYFI